MGQKFNPFTGDLDIVNNKANEITSDNGQTVEDSISILQDTSVIQYDGTTISGTVGNIIVGAGSGYHRDYTTGIVKFIEWSQQEVPALNIATQNNGFVYIDQNGIAQQQNTPLDDIQRRDGIFLDRWTSLDNINVIVVEDKPVLGVGTVQTLRDFMELIGFIKTGMDFSGNAGGLTLSRASGKLFEPGVNYTTNPKQPNKADISAQNPVQLRKATQTNEEIDLTPVTVIDTNNYDVGGVVTAMQPNKFANQRIIQFPTGNVAIYYGQNEYNSINEALANIDAESFVKGPTESQGMWVATITHRTGATDFATTTDLRVTIRDDLSISTSGTTGISTTTLQNTYDNSANPEILTDTTRGALTIRRGSGADTDNVLEIQNGVGNNTFYANGNGDVVIGGDLTVNGTTTTINTQNLLVEDKNIELGVVTTPTDITADGGGITLKGATDKTILWSNTSGLWEFNQGASFSGKLSIGPTLLGTRFGVFENGTNPNGMMVEFQNSSTDGAYIGIVENGLKRWAIGIDDGDTTFKIRQDSYIGATALSIDQNNKATLSKNSLDGDSIDLINQDTLGFQSVVFKGDSYTYKVGSTNNGFVGVADLQNKFFIWDQNQALVRFTLNQTGNIGIGTTTPSARLDVEIDNNTNQSIADFRNSASAGTDRDAYIRLQLNTDNYSVGHHALTNTFQICNAPNLDTNSRIAINSSGDVLINTTSELPNSTVDHKLQVDGFLLHELGWRDLVSPFTSTSAGGSAPTLVTLANGVRLFRFSAGDSVHASYHVDHDYAEGTLAYHHIHWFPETAMNAGDTVTWRIYYIVAKGHNQGESFTGTRTSFDVTYTSPAGGTVAGDHIVSEASDLQAYDIKEPDAVILAEIEMVSKTFAGNVIGIQADLHYQTDREATIGKKPDFNVPD